MIADGPRPDRADDVEKCRAARVVVERIDWEYDILKNYSDGNLGCDRRPATGINWLFEHVEEAIILEGDCVPHRTFFRYSEELLRKYRHDERITLIGGTNDLFGKREIPYSYYFSRIPGCWGWSTWRRAWQHYDVEMKLWPELRDRSWLLEIQGDPRAAETLRNIFDRTYAGLIDTWDHQWNYTCWTQNGLAVLPNSNLVCNIGFGDDSTHLKSTNNKLAYLPTQDMVFPLQHPPYVVRDREADQFVNEQHVITPKVASRPSLYRKLRCNFSAVIPGPMRKSLSYLRSKWT